MSKTKRIATLEHHRTQKEGATFSRCFVPLLRKHMKMPTSHVLHQLGRKSMEGNSVRSVCLVQRCGLVWCRMDPERRRVEDLSVLIGIWCRPGSFCSCSCRRACIFLSYIMGESGFATLWRRLFARIAHPPVHAYLLPLPCPMT